MMMNKDRKYRAVLSLLGLSIGDAYGSRCSLGVHAAKKYPGDDSHILPPGPWRWTDDTAQSIEIVEWLLSGKSFERDGLARKLAERYASDKARGYGQGARKLFDQINRGLEPETVRNKLFGNEGSFGNGAAMRAGPIGAFYTDDLDAVVKEVTESALSTHSHNEGQAGALAIGLCAAVVADMTCKGSELEPNKLFDLIVEYLPDSEVKSKVVQAKSIGLDADVNDVVSMLGSGKTAIAVDTVPFCIWSVARHLNSFGEGIWRTCAAGGDKDTNCAMVGSILVLRNGLEGVPSEWIRRVEPVPEEIGSIVLGK